MRAGATLGVRSDDGFGTADCTTAYFSRRLMMLSPSASRDARASAALRRGALAVEALTATVVAVAAVIIALIPRCVGIAAPRGVDGGLECGRVISLDAWALLLVAVIAVVVVGIALRGFASRSKRSELGLLGGQVPLLIGIGFVLVFYGFNPTRPPVWAAILLALCVAIVVLTSPRPEQLA
jgi:hypothetical protein